MPTSFLYYYRVPSGRLLKVIPAGRKISSKSRMSTIIIGYAYDTSSMSFKKRCRFFLYLTSRTELTILSASAF